MLSIYSFLKVKLCYRTYWKQWLAFLAICFLVFACSDDDEDSTNCILGVPYDDFACLEIYQPVCGCNDITYSNDCYALTAGISSWSEGECEN